MPQTPKRVKKDQQHLKTTIVLLFFECGSYYEVEKRTGVNRAKVRYWVLKVSKDVNSAHLLSFYIQGGTVNHVVGTREAHSQRRSFLQCFLW